MTTTPEGSKRIDTSAATPAPGAETAATVDLGTQIERALSAFVRGGNAAQELIVLDRLYAAHPDAAQVEATARRLFAQPAAFDNLNFHSSLLTNGSQFFGLVLRKMGEIVDAEPALAEGAALPVLIRLSEHFRRKGDLTQMEHFAARVEEQLRERVQRNDTLALAQLAKVRYEQSMGYFTTKDFGRSISVGEESIGLCERAGDEFGVLAARGNTAGLSRYEWARSLGPQDPKSAQLLQEGKPVLEADLLRAQERITQLAEHPGEREKFERVVMNNAIHLMHIADLLKDPEPAGRLKAILDVNPVFQKAFDPQHPGDPAHAQAWAQVPSQILARLAAERQR
ncbi:MAG: hypothetical protein V1876_03990 [Candidatus Peregrinibacteria bacterium]